METINSILQIANYAAMIGCTGIWFWLWRANFKNHLLLSKQVKDLERRIEVLQYEVKVIKEPCYRGEHG